MNKPQIPSTDQTERKAFLQGAIRLDYLASLMGQDEKYEEFLPVLWRESPCREKDLPKDSSGAWYELFYSILPFFIFDPTTSNLITPNKNSKSDSDSVYMLLPVLKQFLKGKGVPIPQGLQEDQEPDNEEDEEQEADEEGEAEVIRGFYMEELGRLDELGKDEQTLANLPPAETFSETQKRNAETARIQRERGEILEVLKRDDAYDILFGGAEPREYDHQSRDATEGTQLSFYRHGDFWKLGKEGQEVPLGHLKGLESIHFLLENPNKEIASSVVYHCGSQPSEEDTMPKHLAREADKVWRDRPQLSEEDNLSVRSAEENYVVIDKKARLELMSKLNELKARKAEIEENPTGDPLGDLETKDAISEKISQIEKVISEARGGRFYTASENARKNVQKNIRYALERIKDECLDLEPFLNKTTIRTGNKCCYSPDPENTPRLMLYKPTN